jgi:hypothetical protein
LYKYLLFAESSNEAPSLGALSADSAGQLDVLRHNGDSLSVDGAQVGVLEETNQVSLRGLLKSQNSGTLESQVRLEVLSDLSHKALEGQLADQQFSGLLVLSDLSEGDSARSVSVGLLDTTSGRGRLSGSLGGQLLARSLASGGLHTTINGLPSDNLKINFRKNSTARIDTEPPLQIHFAHLSCSLLGSCHGSCL